MENVTFSISLLRELRGRRKEEEEGKEGKRRKGKGREEGGKGKKRTSDRRKSPAIYKRIAIIHIGFLK